jgi:hypothetical protein
MTIHEGVLEATKYIFIRSTASSRPTSYLEFPEFKSLSEDHEAMTEVFYVRVTVHRNKFLCNETN